MQLYLEALCCCEVQKVLTLLRTNRKFSDLRQGWRELAANSPVKCLAEWQSLDSRSRGLPLEALFGIVRSPDVAGPATCAALEALKSILQVLMDYSQGLTDGCLSQVVAAVCECKFEETHAPSDEAVVLQMVEVLTLCAIGPSGGESQGGLSAADCLTAFNRIVSFWSHTRYSPTIRALAQDALHRVIEAAVSRRHDGGACARQILDGAFEDIEGPDIQAERCLLYLRLIQRIAVHATVQSAGSEPLAELIRSKAPIAVIVASERFGTSVSVLSHVLPIANFFCRLSVQQQGKGYAPGALHLEAMLIGIYLRLLNLAQATPTIDSASSGGKVAESLFSTEEGKELLVVLLECLVELLQRDVVLTLWHSFDVKWCRPKILEDIVLAISGLLKSSASGDRPMPAYVLHLGAAVIARCVSAFSLGEKTRIQNEWARKDEKARIQKELARREMVDHFLHNLEEKPKKGRDLLEKSGIMDFLECPEYDNGRNNSSPSGTMSSEIELPAHFDPWAKTMVWILRCYNHGVGYDAMGEFFGQPTKDSEMAFAAFVDTIDMGHVHVDAALRHTLQSFQLPKEAQQIDRILKIFAHTYYRKHQEYQGRTGGGQGYLRHPDAAYTLAFSVIMLNTDQHNPRLVKRMQVTDFLRNNRGINEGENIPEDVQRRIFECIKTDEIKTPKSGKMSEPGALNPSRWRDFLQLVQRGYRNNDLVGPPAYIKAHAEAFLGKMLEPILASLELVLASDSGAYSDALNGIQDLMLLIHEQHSTEAENMGDTLFRFGIEVFQESQPRGHLGRASVCLRALFATANAHLSRLSTRQLHQLVYISAQFALYGVFDKAQHLPVDAHAIRLLRLPVLKVEASSRRVFSFIRKMMSFSGEEAAEDDGTPIAASRTGEQVQQSASESVSTLSPSEDKQPEKRAEEGPGANDQTSTAGEMPRSTQQEVADTLRDDPLRPQIERTFESCGIDDFFRVLVENARGPDAGEVMQSLFILLSSLFLVLRIGPKPVGPKPGKEEELPWWPEEKGRPEMKSPGVMQLPKRVLPLNILDGFEVLQLALRVLSGALGQQTQGPSPWDASPVQELSIGIHVGLFHTLRRPDLCDRTLRLSITAVFRISAVLLSLKDSEGNFIVSVGWPTRLIKVLITRTEQELHFLVPSAKLLTQAIRSFVTQVTIVRPLNESEAEDLWKVTLQLLLRAVPTTHRALWSAGKDATVQSLRKHVCMEGIVWFCGHPNFLDFCCCSKDEKTEKEAADAKPPEKAMLVTYALKEMAQLATEMEPSSRFEAGVALIEMQAGLLRHISGNLNAPQYNADEMKSVESGAVAASGSNPTVQERDPHANAKVWCRTIVSFLGIVGPLLARPEGERLVPSIEQAVLDNRVPPLLNVVENGPKWARAALEKLVSVLTGIVNSGPAPVLRASTALVAKFFLQNLGSLQKHEHFDQLWLMVLRLLMLFIKQGIDTQDAQLEEIGTETLKNSLSILMNANLIGFVPAKEELSPEVPVWWRMTWESIELFCPGFGKEFATSMDLLPSEKNGGTPPVAKFDPVTPVECR